MLLLEQGQSFLDDRRRGYRVFTFDLSGCRNMSSCLEPFKIEIFSRIYPNRIGMLGAPGYGFLIAHKLANGDAHMWMGFIGWDGYPVLWHNHMVQRKGETGTWNGLESIWYAEQHIAFTRRMIDHRTKVIVALTKENAARYKEVQSNRAAAEQASKDALKAFKKRGALERKRKKEKQKLEAEERLLREREKWHADEILANLAHVHGRLLIWKELKNIEATEQWL